MAQRPAEVTPAVKAALEEGGRETTTLAEALAIDLAALLRQAAPSADWRAMQAASGQGILKRMALGAELLLASDGAAAPERFGAHPSDTLRGMAALAVGRRGGTLAAQLDAIRPFAADAHFGVREWAWMALRPAIAAAPAEAIARLLPWTGSADANLRRFASEATRPRGVWCAHIVALRRDPAPGIALLEPLRADPARYVQLSVGNWLNDAAKDRPELVRALAARWAEASTGPETAHILRRALRSLGPPVMPRPARPRAR